MYCTRKITDDLYYVGASEKRLERFENLFPLENGVSYNSYLFLDEKTCLLDTVDSSVSRQFIENVEHVLNGRKLDYLIIHHMEPDHCANIEEILLRHPETVVVGNAKTFLFIKQFYPELNLEERSLVVKENDTLALGRHTLKFAFTPMVHWPEVMMSYELSEGLLFTADAFGTFRALDGNLFFDQLDFEHDYLDEARRYYTNIVGKYGTSVQAAFKKLTDLDVRMILPLHGPVIRRKTDIAYMLDKYTNWSTYTPEDKGVIIVYGSMYGNNENAAYVLANLLSEKGVKAIKLYDASKTTASTLVAESFRVSNIVIICPTYNASIFPSIDNYVEDILRMNLHDRTLSIIQSGTWAPTSGNLLKAKLAKAKFNYTETEITILSSLTEKNLEELDKLAEEIKTTF